MSASAIVRGSSLNGGDGDDVDAIPHAELASERLVGLEGGFGGDAKAHVGDLRRDQRKGAEQQVDALILGEVSRKDQRAASPRLARWKPGGVEMIDLHAIRDDRDAFGVDAGIADELVANRVGDADRVIGERRQPAIQQPSDAALDRCGKAQRVVGQLGHQQRVCVVHERHATIRSRAGTDQDALVVMRMDDVEPAFAQELLQQLSQRAVDDDDLAIGRSRGEPRVGGNVCDAMDPDARFDRPRPEVIGRDVHVMTASGQCFRDAQYAHRRAAGERKRAGGDDGDFQSCRPRQISLEATAQ